MFNNDTIGQIKRLNFEDFLWLVFAVLCFANIYGDYNEKEYLNTNLNIFKNNSNKIFEFTLIITLLIYFYFFIRNYKTYKKVSADEKNLYYIKILGSALLISGIICLIYFQTKQTSFIGTPSL